MERCPVFCRTSLVLSLVFLLLSAGLTFGDDDEIIKPDPKNKDTFAKIRFKKVTEEKFRFIFTPSFAIAVTSFQADPGRNTSEKIKNYLDDIVIGRHAETAPMVLINKGAKLVEATKALPESVSGDLHGVFAGDVNQDGHRDLLIAGGGGEGVTSGKENLILLNSGRSRKNLTFEDATPFNDLGPTQSRARHLMPFVDGVDDRVKYLMITKPISGYPNSVFTTNEAGELFELTDHSLRLPLNSEARGDSFVDIDGDNDLDFVINDDDKVRIFRNDSGLYSELKADETKILSSTLKFKNLGEIGWITTAKWADINNDGTMDLYLGRRAGNINGDQYAFGEEDGRNLVQFCFIRHGQPDTFDEITFRLRDSKININFVRRPGIGSNEPDDIFVGAANINPGSRNALILAKDALGHNYDKPGIYIYHTGEEKGYYTWHLRWYSSPEEREQLGRVYLNGVPQMGDNGLEVKEVNPVSDLVFLNRGFKKGQLRLQHVPMDLEHIHITRDAVWIDLNNDGLMDLAGVRGNFRGAENGNPFVLINEGNNSKKMPSFWNQPTTYLTADEDFLSQADCIAVGFFNNDGLPDTVVTNGYGLNPGNRGPIEFFYNVTETQNNWTIVVLQGQAPNREAIGAHVRLTDATGKYISGIRQVGANYNRIQSTNKLHFGLGDYRGIIKAEITWPDGSKETRNIKPRMVNFVINK